MILKAAALLVLLHPCRALVRGHGSDIIKASSQKDDVLRKGESLVLTGDSASKANLALLDDQKRAALKPHLRQLETFTRANFGDPIEGEVNNEDFGWSVALSADGNIVAVGGINYPEVSVARGRVQAYFWNGTAWDRRGLPIEGANAMDEAGSTVALSADGSVMAVGSKGHDVAGSNAGHVRVFQWNDSDWVPKGSAINGEMVEDYSAVSALDLSADGSVLSIGAKNDEGTADRAGHVRMYKWNDTESKWDRRGIFKGEGRSASSAIHSHSSNASAGGGESRQLAIVQYPWYNDVEYNKNWMFPSEIHGENWEKPKGEINPNVNNVGGHYFDPTGGVYIEGVIYLLSSNAAEDVTFDPTTIYGIMAFDAETLELLPDKNIKFSLSSNDRYITMDWDGDHFWVCSRTLQKVFVYDLEGTQIKVVDIPKPWVNGANYEPRHISVGSEYFYIGYQHSDGRGADKYNKSDGSHVKRIDRPSGTGSGVCIMTHVQNDGTLWCNYQNGMVKYDETETSAVLVLNKSNLPSEMQEQVNGYASYLNHPSYASGLDKTTNDVYFYNAGVTTKHIITWSSEGVYLGKTEINPNAGDITFISPHPEGGLVILGMASTFHEALKYVRDAWSAPTTALSVYEQYKVVGGSSTSSTPCSAITNQVQCSFKAMKDGETDPSDPPLPSSLKAVVVPKACSAASKEEMAVLAGTADNAQVSVSGFFPAVSADEKNCGENPQVDGDIKYCTVLRPFCARAELFDTSNGDTSVLAEILEGVVTYKYYKNGDFSTGVTTEAYVPNTADTEVDITNANLGAYRCEDNGNEVEDDTKVTMGQILNVCIHSTNTDVTVAITEFQLKNGDTVISEPISSTGQPNLVTAVKFEADGSNQGVATSNIQVVSTLMTPAIFDQAGGQTLTATGKANLTYGGRKLKQVRFRALQDSDDESFSVEFELTGGEIPAIAMGSKANTASTVGVLGAMASMAFGAFTIM